MIDPCNSRLQELKNKTKQDNEYIKVKRRNYLESCDKRLKNHPTLQNDS